MAEANARMHLREIVRDEDVNLAISVMLEGFIQSQKFSVAKTMRYFTNPRKKFQNYLINMEDDNALLSHILYKLYRENVIYIFKIILVPQSRILQK